jgi:hypothetical protein
MVIEMKCPVCEKGTLKKGEVEEEMFGIWGLAEKLKMVKSGNSLVLRIPAKIAKFLDIKAGNEILLYPEGKKKAVFEIT